MTWDERHLYMILLNLQEEKAISIVYPDEIFY